MFVIELAVYVAIIINIYLQEEDNEYEWSLSLTSDNTSNHNDNSASDHSHTIYQDEHLGEVWAPVPGVGQYLSEEKSGDNKKDTSECLEIDTDTENHQRPTNLSEMGEEIALGQIQEPGPHVDISLDPRSPSHFRTRVGPTLRPPSGSSGTSGSVSTRSSRFGNAVGEVDTGKADTVAYFNL